MKLWHGFLLAAVYLFLGFQWAVGMGIPPEAGSLAFSGLLTDYMRSIGAHIIVRGVRSVKDLEYEENEAHMLHHLDASVETVFLLTNPAYSFVSSSGIRELAAFRGDVHGLVPACVERAVRARWSAESR